jgi:hypothetical protein
METLPRQTLPNFTSQDRLVTIRTTSRPRRYPNHNYPVVILELRPSRGTRVLTMPDGGISFMPRFSEILALCLRLGLTVSAIPDDKPPERRLKFERLNALRHRKPKV